MDAGERALMGRRNQITAVDAWIVALVAVGSAVAATMSPVSPTGSSLADIVLVGAFAALVTWCGASAPWWALVVGSGIATAITLAGPWPSTVLAALALAASAWIGAQQRNLPVLRAIVATIVVQVALRFDWDPFFLASAGAAAIVTLVIIGAGLARRRRRERRAVIIGSIVVGILAIAAGAGAGVAAAEAREPASAGYTSLLDGLDSLESGDSAAASEELRAAADSLRDARDRLNRPFALPARWVPGLAQNSRAARDVLDEASDTAGSAASALSQIDLDALTVSDGRVDVEALAALAEPLTAVRDAVYELRQTLYDNRSDWLVAPLRSRLDEAIEQSDQVASQVNATAAAARIGPAMLGADGPRTYLLAFVNAAEARGQSGLMGNWAEVTIDGGQFVVSATGRTADLQAESLRDLELDMPDEYLARYGPLGAQIDGGVLPKFWSNVTAPADMPSVGSAMKQMYENATGNEIDGVVVIDAAGMASLLELAGPIEIESIERSLSADDLEDFLLLEQYEYPEAEREQVLEAITQQTLRNVLDGELPPAQEIVATLGSPVLNGHISGWAERGPERDLFRFVGMDAGLPQASTSGTDAFAVVSNNASGNKIENFLERTIEYRPSVAQRTGDVSATMRITLFNGAPAVGYDDYVIGNIIGAPSGTNRMLLDVYTRLEVESATMGGDPVPTDTQRELGYNVHRQLLDIGPGATVVVELELAGNVAPGLYELVVRPQPLPRPDTLIIDARTSDGETLFDFDGEIERRTVFSASGADAWR